MRSRILVGLIAGTIGGAIGWFLQEQLIDYSALARAGGELSVNGTRSLVLAVGGMLGLLLGTVDGIVEGNPRKLVRGALIGVICGIVFGTIGFAFGNVIFTALGGRSIGTGGGGIVGFARQVLARTMGWSLFGMALGAGSAVGSRSPKRILNGALGGLIGGFAGGFVFDMVAQLYNPVESVATGGGVRDVGGPSRAIGFTAIGGLSGLFIGIVDELLKQAWVRVLVGRNEGREYLLARQMSILGRDERCDVPLFGDRSVAVQHAAIRAEGGRYLLIDAGSPTGTIVNGHRIDPAEELLLRDGDTILIGKHQIEFREKAGDRAMAPTDRERRPATPAAIPAVGAATNVCPFCGATKDAAGNCLCSIGGPVAPAPPGFAIRRQGLPAPAGPAGIEAPPPAYHPGPTGGAAHPGTGGSSGLGRPIGEEDMARLVGLEGPYTGEIFFLNAQNNSLGRGSDRDIVLSADQTVSRNHAHITNEGGDLVVYDDNSSNGTFVNGLRISMQVLVPGDIVQLGQYSKFRYE